LDKIIEKILEKRIRKVMVLGGIIDEKKFAFLGERNILDGVFIIKKK